MRQQPSLWHVWVAVSLLLILVLVLLVTSNLFLEQPRVVPAAQMMADWHEMERMAKQYPYKETEQSDGHR